MKISRTDISEQELIELVTAHKNEGLDLLYTKYSSVLYGVSLKIVGSENIAKDVLQEAFVKIWKNFSKYDRSKGRLITWLLNITRNTANDHTKSQEFPNTSNFSSEYPLSNQSGESEMKIDQTGQQKVLNLLNPESKSVLERVYIHGDTHSEAAEFLNLPVGTVKIRVRNGLMELRKTIK